MKIIAITQARCGSTRLPNKVLKKINNETLLQIHLQRALKSKRIDELIVATTRDSADDAIVEIVNRAGINFYRGSVDNVLERFYHAAKPHDPDLVVRLTSDCPLIDPGLIDEIIVRTTELNVDYCSNTLKPTYPDGMDVEVFKFSALRKAWKEATLQSEQEHVTPYIHKNSSYNKRDLFTSHNFENSVNYGNVRLTVDEQKDLDVIRELILKLGTEERWEIYADYYLENQKIKNLNGDVLRNEGYINSLKKE